MENLQTVLIIGFVWPEPNSSAAGNRMMQLLNLFLSRGWTITFASTASDSDYMENLENLGVSRQSIALNSADFDLFISDLNPSIVLFDRFMTEEQFGWRVARQCPNALKILDSEDLHSLRLSRQKAVKEHRNFILTDLFGEETAKREIASIFRCDLTLIISEFEMALLQETFKIDENLLYYLPLFSALKQTENLTDFESRAGFIFIGNFLHEPNKDAVIYLKQKVWPHIHKRLPKAPIHIYGAYASESIRQLQNINENFLIHGRADNASEVVRNARVVLAPLRFGAGIKGKLLEAMECGTPSITTSIGAEAMHGNLPWGGIICDDPETFGHAATEMYQDENKWRNAQQNGFTIVAERHDRHRYETEFINLILEIRKQLSAHRAQNFVGAMLLHHSMRSTEYMSRWIEAKNKN